MNRLCRHFRATAYLTNAQAISRLNELKEIKRGNEGVSIVTERALEILRNIGESVSGTVLDALLSTAIREQHPQLVLVLWPELQHFHRSAQRRQTDPLNYSLLMKCVIRSGDGGHFDLSKCITVLQWMTEHKNDGTGYTLKIHSSLITKLVAQCGASHDVESLQYVHSLIARGSIATKPNDQFIASALIKAYGACKEAMTALDVFRSFPTNRLDSVLLGAAMTALINNYHYTAAIEVYESQCESLRNDVVRTLAMKAFTKNNQFTKSLDVHSKMDSLSTKSRELMLLKTASKGSMIEVARRFKEEGAPKEAEAVAHLLNLYGKCGMVQDAECVFGAQSESSNAQDVRIWNAMLRVYGRNHRLDDVLRCYGEMKQLRSVEADCSTFVIVMNALNHCGDTLRAQRVWSEEIGGSVEIKYDEKVISVLVDCMAKEGQFEEAMTLLLSIGDCSYESAWIALLDGTRRLNQLGMAERVYREIWKRFESNAIIMSSAATLISHLYTMNGEMRKRKAVRKLMERRGWTNTKRHGKATVQIEAVIYTFCAGLEYQDRDCVLTEEERKGVGAALESLCNALRADHGFQHDLSVVTNRVRSEEERVQHVREHSEKLALCYWMLRQPDSKEVVISNSQRICNDCHLFMAAVSKMKCIQITVAEPNLIHVFKDGSCSCNPF